MGVSDGTPVNAATTNPAFLDANADDTALGKITLNNISDPGVSGPVVTNIQRELNAFSSYTGKPTNVAYTTTPSWFNNQVGAPTDNLFLRADALTATFDGTTGHAHDGTDGEGPLLSGTSLFGVPYTGYFVEGTDLIGVTGTSTDVSVELTGAVPSTAATVLGVVVNTPYNKVTLRYASGTNENDQIFDSLGNIVYGRVNESVGVWTLSYYVLIGATETAYSFSSTDVRWYYQQIFDTMVSTPVYSPLAVIPSDNATADIIDATTTQKGKVQLATSSVSVGALNLAGTANATVANANHAHQGIHALQEFAEGVNVFNDVVLKAGVNMTITRTSQTFEFEAAGSGVMDVEYFTLSPAEIAAKQVTLALTPTTAAYVMLDVIGGGAQVYSVDYTVSGAILSWAALGLDGVLSSGDMLRVVYIAVDVVEYRTLTAGEIAADQLTLGGTPLNGGLTLVDLIGGGTQVYGTDFTVTGAILGWSGLGLDGLVSAGDILRIAYRV